MAIQNGLIASKTLGEDLVSLRGLHISRIGVLSIGLTVRPVIIGLNIIAVASATFVCPMQYTAWDRI